MEAHSQSPYEVHCPRCQVSFPVGTKSCLHCGERIGRPRLLRAARQSVGAPPPPILEEAGEDEMPTRSGLMSPVAILWVVLILGSAIYRACN